MARNCDCELFSTDRLREARRQLSRPVGHDQRSLTLHELVMRFAPTQTRTKWHKARKKQWRKDDWHPIKNRTPRGPSLPPTEPVLGLTDEIGRLRVKELH